MTVLDWINTHQKIKDTINWEKGPRDFVNFSNWTDQMKSDLEKAYNLVEKYEWILTFPDPPPNLKELNDDDWCSTWISASNAWAIYIAHLAQSLCVEIKRKVKWSILSYAADDLRELFESRAFFICQLIDRGINYYIDYWKCGNAMPGTPSLPWVLLKYTTGIANTPEQTVANLLQWCRENLAHFGMVYAKEYFTAAQDAHWQYRGYTPTSRVIMGTKKEYDNDELKVHIHEPQKMHWTAGCHGTNGFLRNVLRVVNIPVLYERYAGHALPNFPTIGKHLSHGDDPYSLNVKTAGYPSSYLLMDDQEFYEVYNDIEAAENQNNLKVGHMVFQLNIKYLPLTLLNARVADGYESDNTTNVFETFKNWEGKTLYTVEELKAKNLWVNLDAKIKAYGGPGKIPSKEIGDYLWDVWRNVLMKKTLIEQNKLQLEAKRKYEGLQRKKLTLEDMQRTNVSLKNNLTQLLQSSQPSTRTPAPSRKSTLPKEKQPPPPKDRPPRRPRKIIQPLPRKP